MCSSVVECLPRMSGEGGWGEISVLGWAGQSRIVKIQSRNSYFSYNGCIRNLAEMPFFHVYESFRDFCPAFEINLEK